MVAAVRDLWPVRAVAERGAQPHPDARCARDRPDPAHDHLRPEHAAVNLQARTEIEDLDRAVRRVEPRRKDRGVAEILLLGSGAPAEIDRPSAARIFAAIAVDQRVEHRVPVESRQAAPDHAAGAVDQRRDHAVADHAEVEVTLHVHRPRSRSIASRLSCSQ